MNAEMDAEMDAAHSNYRSEEIIMLSSCILIFACIVFILIKAYQYIYYYERWSVPHPPEVPFVGAVGVEWILRRHPSYTMKRLYHTSRRPTKYIGCHKFFDKWIVLLDLDLVNFIFHEKFFLCHIQPDDVEKLDPMYIKHGITDSICSENRAMIQWMFSTEHVDVLQFVTAQCARRSVHHMLKIYMFKDADVTDLFAKFAIDAVAWCAFGHEICSVKNDSNPFYNYTKAITERSLCRRISSYCINKIFGSKPLDEQSVDFFKMLISSCIQDRNEERQVPKPDLLDLMIKERDVTNPRTLEMLTKSVLYFLRTYESISLRMSMMAYELATNPDVQSRLQYEIDHTMQMSTADPSYSQIKSMKYLDAVFRETMRRHCPPYITRVCRKKFELPPAVQGGHPFPVEPGTQLVVPVGAIHGDANHFEQPARFDPSRYVDPASGSRGVCLTFGQGKSKCLAEEFVTMEIKTFFVHFLYKVEIVASSTLNKTQRAYNSKGYAEPQNGVYIRLLPRRYGASCHNYQSL